MDPERWRPAGGCPSCQRAQHVPVDYRSERPSILQARILTTRRGPNNNLRANSGPFWQAPTAQMPQNRRHAQNCAACRIGPRRRLLDASRRPRSRDLLDLLHKRLQGGAFGPGDRFRGNFLSLCLLPGSQRSLLVANT